MNLICHSNCVPWRMSNMNESFRRRIDASHNLLRMFQSNYFNFRCWKIFKFYSHLIGDQVKAEFHRKSIELLKILFEMFEIEQEILGETLKLNSQTHKRNENELLANMFVGVVLLTPVACELSPFKCQSSGGFNSKTYEKLTTTEFPTRHSSNRSEGRWKFQPYWLKASIKFH